MKIIFLVQHLGQPRCIKRILSIKDAGYDVLVYGFDRGNYSENINQLLEQNVLLKESITSKGLSKIEKIKAYIRIVRKAVKDASKDDLIYAFGFELATFTRLITTYKYIYECADIVGARENSEFLLMLDRRNIKKSVFTVFTSAGFVDFFWGNKKEAPEIRKTYVIQPNKLNGYFLEHKRPNVKQVGSGVVRFGYAGLLRFLDIYLLFCELIGTKYPNYEFHFWGDADEAEMKKILNVVNAYSNIYYHGVFTNPRDLDKVYESFDVCVLCYDIRSGNVKIAEPNKFYESIYYCKPIVASRGTYLGDKVERIGVGETINADEDGIKAYLDNISSVRLNEMMLNEKHINADLLVDNSDELYNRLTLAIN